jgi:hypothetical protein
MKLFLLSALSAVVAASEFKLLPTKSQCATLCPGCDTPDCKCPVDACWPGSGDADTPDSTCKCFGMLGFCAEGEEPVYKKGEICPSCWPSENHACDCFAVLPFCDAPSEAAAPASLAAVEEEIPTSNFTKFKRKVCPMIPQNFADILCVPVPELTAADMMVSALMFTAIAAYIVANRKQFKNFDGFMPSLAKPAASMV